MVNADWCWGIMAHCGSGKSSRSHKKVSTYSTIIPQLTQLAELAEMGCSDDLCLHLFEGLLWGKPDLLAELLRDSCMHGHALQTDCWPFRLVAIWSACLSLARQQAPPCKFWVLAEAQPSARCVPCLWQWLGSDLLDLQFDPLHKPAVSLGHKPASMHVLPSTSTAASSVTILGRSAQPP